MNKLLKITSTKAAVALGAVVSMLVFMAFAVPVSADVDPSLCTDNGGGISIAAFRQDGITSIGATGTVTDGENINYKATLSALAFPNCAFEGGTWTLTTPNGVVHNLGSVPRVGGTGVASFSSALIPYTVSHADEIVNSTRHLNATTAYGGGISHADPLDETDGPTLGASKITKVVHTPTVVTEIHKDSDHSVVTTVPVGTTVHDKATVSFTGGPVPTGTVTFTRYTDANCDGGATGAGTVALSAGVADPSTAFTTTSAGSMSYKAHYNGDTNYNAADASCEPLTVTKLDSTTTTDVHDSSHAVITTAVVGSLVHDNAHVVGNGVIAPTGSVSFQLYSDKVCGTTSGSPEVVSLDGTGHSESSPLAAVAPGMSYKATYSGDGAYNSSVGDCEPLTVTLKTPTVVTEIHTAAEAVVTSATAGVTVHDKATISGSGGTPTGTVDFTFFNNGTCTPTGAPSGTGVALDGSGVAHPSASQGPLSAGSYSFMAHYNGDSNFAAADGTCEPLTVSQLTPTVTTDVHTDSPDQTFSGSLTAPAAAHDKATVTGSGPVPTGTVDFTFYSGTGAGTCSADATHVPSGTGIALVAGVAHPSTSQTGLGAGTYAFKAHYNGDIVYAAANGACEPFTVVAQGHIIVKKVTVPSGDSQSFAFTATGTGYNGFSLTDGQQNDSGLLNAGSYSVAETAVTGWDSDGGKCDNNQTPASINLQAGQTVTCTFTNTKRGHIIVKKVTSNSDTTTKFTFTTTGSNYSGFQLVGGGQNDSGALVPGGYSVAETSMTGWSSDGGLCVSSQQVSQAPGSITLHAGETVTCTFNNTFLVIQSCSPGYWKNHTSHWPGGYSPNQTFASVFGSSPSTSLNNMSLKDVLAQGGGGINAFGRQVVNALLNAAVPLQNYPWTTSQVISMVHQALVNKDYNTFPNQITGLGDICPLN